MCGGSEPPGSGSSFRLNDKEEQVLMAGFLDSLAKYQEVMKQLQTQAKKLMMVRASNHSDRNH